MAATRTQAEQCDPNALDALIKEWQTAHDTATTGLDKTGNEYGQSYTYWTGRTGDRARETVEQTVRTARLFAGDLQTAITTLGADRDAIWRAKNSATQAITNAVNAKYDVSEEGVVDPAYDAKVAAQTSSSDSNDQAAAVAALTKFGKDIYEPPIKTALAELGTAVEAARTRIVNALPNAGGVTTAKVEMSGKLDPNRKLTGDQGKEDGETIADGKLSDDERQRILEHLAQTGLTDEQRRALERGEAVTLPQSTMDYLTNLYDNAGRDGLLTLSETLKDEKSPASIQLRQELANGMLTVSNERVVSRDSQGKIADHGGFNKLDSEVRELVGTRPNIGGAPDSNTSNLPDDYRPSVFGRDHSGAIKDYTADMARFGDFMNSSEPGYQPGERFGVEMGRQAEHQAWILDNGGYGHWEGTKLADTEANAHTESSASALLGVAARNHDASYALITGNGSDELFGKDTPAQSWHKYDAQGAMEGLFRHEWNGDGKSLGALVSWTGEDAYNPDLARAAHAGEAASVISDMMTSTKTSKGTNFFADMMDMPGQDGQSFAQVNPEAARGMALGLRPFAGDIIGAPPELTGTHGFPGDKLGPVDATRLFTILDGDKIAGATMNGAALAQAEQIDRHFAISSALGQQDPLDYGQYSGRLRGVVDTGINLGAADYFATEAERAQAKTDQNAAAYGVAQNLLGTVGMAGPAGGIGGPVVQAISEYYKTPLTSVDPGYSGYSEPTTADGHNIQQDNTIGSRRYNMLAGLVESSQLPPYMLPSQLHDLVVQDESGDHPLLRPYSEVVQAPGSADRLDRSLPGVLQQAGVPADSQSGYLANGDQAAKSYQQIYATAADDKDRMRRLRTPEIEINHNQWIR